MASGEDDPSLRIYEYTLYGGWPTENSVIRLFASVLASITPFSFSLLATRLSNRNARCLFCTTLLAILSLVTGSIVLDVVAIRRTSAECWNSLCLTAVPETVLNSENICMCSVGTWFYVTLVGDILLASASFICFIELAFNKTGAVFSNRLPPNLMPFESQAAS